MRSASQELELRWLLSLSLLKKGFLKQAQSEEPDSTEEPPKKQVSCGYSWSGNRPPPRELDRIVFPEAVIAALRTVAMTEAELHATVGLLDEVCLHCRSASVSPLHRLIVLYLHQYLIKSCMCLFVSCSSLNLVNFANLVKRIFLLPSGKFVVMQEVIVY